MKFSPSQMVLQQVIREVLKEIGTYLEGLNRETYKTFWMENNIAFLCWPRAAWCCSEL